MSRDIRIENARSHNLRGVSCTIPLGRLTVVTGVSGSGKSSLAFDTLYAEGQRRYVASLSTYARQFLEQLPRPDVDRITHLPPAIAIEQRNAVTNARSTVGSATEILDHLRLLYARVGETRCCGEAVEEGSVEATTNDILARFDGARALITAPLPQRKGETGKDLSERLLRDGYTRLCLPDGQLVEVGEVSTRRLATLRKGASLVIDRLAVRASARSRVAEAVASAFARGEGYAELRPEGAGSARYREGFACRSCGRLHPRPEPALFSFDSPLGACEACQGFGRVAALDLRRVIPDEGRSLAGGAIAPFQTPGGKGCQRDLAREAKQAGVPLDRPWRALSQAQREWVVDGEGDWYGVQGYFDWLERRRYKVQARVTIARYRRFDPCPDCDGRRLRSEALEVFVGGRDIGDVARSTIGELGAWIDGLDLAGSAHERGARILELLRARVETAARVGLAYLSLERQVRTLSGGEAQRIQLATALGGTLVSALYVLDEPSVGLHARDIARLLSVLQAIRDRGNTVVVVEHAPAIIRAADHLIDLGPGAGSEGGRLLAEGPVQAVAETEGSPTGRLLGGGWRPRRDVRRKARGELRVRGARAQNLQGVDVSIPLGQLVVVSGVSGAGKSTLVRNVLVGHLQGDPDRGACDGVEGGEAIDEVVVVEPTAPARSLRSNPATVSKAFDGIRKRFAASREATRRGLSAGWFSFNVPGGRCEKCEGAGETVVDMQFLEDLRVPCEHCEGTRYRSEAREIEVAGRSIVDVLDLTLAEAAAAFASDRTIASRLAPYVRVGLGYLTLGQPLTTLSGGELQRLRLAAALSGSSERTLYVFDEPTTGLHPAEIQVLLDCLDELLADGGSVVVVEHDLDVIRQADHVIDVGPEGGPGGGGIVVEGTPEEVMANAVSLTGAALRSEA